MEDGFIDEANVLNYWYRAVDGKIWIVLNLTIKELEEQIVQRNKGDAVYVTVGGEESLASGSKGERDTTQEGRE